MFIWKLPESLEAIELVINNNNVEKNKFNYIKTENMATMR